MTSPKKLNPSLVALAAFIGRWDMEICWSPKTHESVGGPSTVLGCARFEWIEDGHYVIQYQGSADGPPDARWLIGRDEGLEEYCILYSDARGISRVYQMTFDGRVWRIWRNAPAFDHYQRFEGRLSSDGRSIDARWERSADGQVWEHDFDLSYVKTV